MNYERAKVSNDPLEVQLFVYGGGVTHHQLFQLPLGILIGAGWAWLGWTFRRNPRTLILIGLSAGLWLVAISSEWRRELVISAMGHGGELILATRAKGEKLDVEVLHEEILTGLGGELSFDARPARLLKTMRDRGASLGAFMNPTDPDDLFRVVQQTCPLPLRSGRPPG